MPDNRIRLDRRAAVESILYIANRIPRADFFTISKVQYFADLKHLEMYGRLIAGDEYIAMKNGPVPSFAYDAMKAGKSGTSRVGFPEVAGAFHVENNFIVVPDRDADTDWFSISDIECLDEAIRKYSRMKWTLLRYRSHGLAWSETDRDRPISLELIAKELGNPDGLLEHLSNPNP